MLPQADQLIGHHQETVRLYLSHFYNHWVGNKQALRPKEFEEIVKTYAQPEAARGSIAWYRAGGGSGQVALASGNIPPVPITHPTMILWGETDPIAPPAWADRLATHFPTCLGCSSCLTLVTLFLLKHLRQSWRLFVQFSNS